MLMIIPGVVRSYTADEVLWPGVKIPANFTDFDIGCNARWSNKSRPSNPIQAAGWDEADRMDKEVGL